MASQPGDRGPAPQPLSMVQDLLNTIDLEEQREVLIDAEALNAFARDHGLALGQFEQADVLIVREFREALRDLVGSHGGDDFPEQSRKLLYRLWGSSPLALHVDAVGNVALRPAPELAPVAGLVAEVVTVIAAASIDNTWVRLKSCSNSVCRWAYYDRSPSGRSRWCSMALCGSRAKMRSYRIRHQP